MEFYKRNLRIADIVIQSYYYGLLNYYIETMAI